MKQMIMSFLIICILQSAGAELALAHGEDKPGPHGGIIRMPASYHSEIVPRTDSSFQVYLLDIQFKNPLVDESSVRAVVKHEGSKVELSCLVQEDHFVCETTGDTKLQSGILALVTIRQGVTGSNQFFELPLSVPESTQKN